MKLKFCPRKHIYLQNFSVSLEMKAAVVSLVDFSFFTILRSTKNAPPLNFVYNSTVGFEDCFLVSGSTF